MRLFICMLVGSAIYACVFSPYLVDLMKLKLKSCPKCLAVSSFKDNRNFCMIYLCIVCTEQNNKLITWNVSSKISKKQTIGLSCFIFCIQTKNTSAILSFIWIYAFFYKIRWNSFLIFVSVCTVFVSPTIFCFKGYSCCCFCYNFLISISFLFFTLVNNFCYEHVMLSIN